MEPAITVSGSFVSDWPSKPGGEAAKGCFKGRLLVWGRRRQSRWRILVPRTVRDCRILGLPDAGKGRRFKCREDKCRAVYGKDAQTLVAAYDPGFGHLGRGVAS